MSYKDTLAFPLPYGSYSDEAVSGETELFGMTLLDYFAAKAMQGAIAGTTGVVDLALCALCASWSYDMAEAMMVEREKRNG